MEVVVSNSVWDSVLEVTKVAQEKGSDPLLWAMRLSTNLTSVGVSLPSIELAQILVSYICWENNVPILWKFLEKALTFGIVPPLLALANLSIRVIPNRHSQPAAYRLYLELLKRHAFTIKTQISWPSYHKVMNSIDNCLHLSRKYGLQASEPGILMVEYMFSIVSQLLDASLADDGLLGLTPEKESIWKTKTQDMEIDSHNSYNEKRTDRHEKMLNINTMIAIELIGQFLQDKVTSKILHLARRNIPTHWTGFIHRLRILGANSMTLNKSKGITPEDLLHLSSDTRNVFSRVCKTGPLQKFHTVMTFGTLASSSGPCHGSSRSGLWLPLDLVLEDAMDGYEVTATSAIEIVTGLIKVLQAVNGTTWHETFLGLWISALRLVQRERDPIEGPMPHLDTRLCMLLSIITLVVAELIEEEESTSHDQTDDSPIKSLKDKQIPGKRRRDLVSSLQVLGDYESLLTPSQCVVSAANQAAAKATMFISGINVGSGYFNYISLKDTPPTKCAGNMRHLLVEACIARNLLDTSAYFWPGYANGRVNQIPHTMPSQLPGWPSFMKGAPLTPPMINALVLSPASSLAELDKIFGIAVKGSTDEKISAASILCGASLIRGWNIQEHTVQFITRLLSPPVPADYSETESHLITYAPILNVLIVGIGSVDCVQIFSLHGLVPQLAASLMPICEVFGSCLPNVSWTLATGEEISPHAVFSNAFTLLLNLWRFNYPPLEHGVGDFPTVGSQLTPEYLLLVRNSHILPENAQKEKNKIGLASSSPSLKPIFMDSFPKLKVWYRQHQACIASTLSGLVHGTPVHQIVDDLLRMMFRKINRGSQSVTSVTSGSSSSPGPPTEDTSLGPKLPAWDILEAIPFVVDAALTACAHGKLSPRELATGLKDLSDFLPASLATIISYFSAEVTRCVWKPVFMNGTDWPSPAANLSNVVEKIKKIIAATGVDLPSLDAEFLMASGSSPATLPLPLAAFVSLTITYKIDKVSQRILNLAGPALESLAAGCPWPCMPIVASLWTQKAKRWSDFLVFSSSRTVFLHNKDAVVQLLKSCFAATLGLNPRPISSKGGGVGALLGHGFGFHFNGGISPVAPGILYLRVRRSIKDIVFVNEEMVSILMQCVREIASNNGTTKKRKNYRYGQVSLSAAMARVKLAASLAASLIWLSGGLGLVQSLIKETLPSWFISVHRSDNTAGSSPSSGGGMFAMLGGYALAYFAFLCGAFAWGLDSSSSASKRRPKNLGIHMEFLASALDGKISLGCDCATWRAYVTGFVSLMIDCTPNWMLEVDADVLKRVSKGLRQWNEGELALALLGIGGVGTMSAAAELIVETQF